VTQPSLLAVQPSHTAATQGERDTLDRYYTPPEVALTCTRWLATVPELGAPRVVVESAAGGGAWIVAAREVWPQARTVGYDLDPRAQGLYLCDEGHHADWLAVEPPRSGARRGALVLGNPDYRQAEAHVRQSLRHAESVAYLLRLGFLSSQARRPMWQEHPPTVVGVLPKRPSFTGNGKTDGADYAVFVWTRAGGPPRIEWFD
jgi:hypothetical protein